MSKEKTIMNKRTTSIIASIAMVAVTAVSLGTATFAWFTRGTEAAATGFDFTASTAAGIQISTDAEPGNWGSNISAADFDTTTVGGVQYGNRVSVQDMDPISAVNTVSSGAYTFWKADYVSATDDFTIGSTADSTNFLMFDLYFLNEGATNIQLRLTSGSTVVDGTLDKDTALSTRVGFIVEGSDTSANYAAVRALESGATGSIWEPNSIVRSGSAINNGAQEDAKYNYNGLTAGATGVLRDDYGSLVSGAYSSLVSNTFDLAVGDSGIIATLPGNSYITKITVFVWIEGQDIDCNNATSGGDVNIDLHFDAGEDNVAGHLTGKTVSSISDTTLNLSATGSAGATYNAYVLRTTTDSNSGLSYRQLIATGSDMQPASPGDLATISLDAAPAVDDVVVIKATLLGFIEARTTYTVV